MFYGAKIDRIKELSEKWGCDLKDLIEYMVRVLPSNEEKRGLIKYFEEIVKVDYNDWMDWLSETPNGKEPNWETMPKN